MYGDNESYDGRRESRPISYASSPLGGNTDSYRSRYGENEISQSPRSPPARDPPLRKMSNDQSYHNSNGQRNPLSPTNRNWEQGNMQSKPTVPRSDSWGGENLEAAKKTGRQRAPSETAKTSFPVADFEFERDEMSFQQELSNLQALRRMSLDVGTTGDPDLPALNSPTSPPGPLDGDEDASRLFWVPAKIHPELAPKEFKAFLENKTEQIKRKSGEFNMPDDSLAQRSNSLGVGSGLRRKKSMLSRQIDNSNGKGGEGYQDGAERLERKRSSRGEYHETKLEDLASIVNDPERLQRLSLESSQQQSPVAESPVGEDVPIIPTAPGASLRRSTRTTYRRGSTQKKPTGDRATFAKRMARAAEAAQAASPVKPPPPQDDTPRITTTPPVDDKPPRLPPITTNFSRPARSATPPQIPPLFDEAGNEAERSPSQYDQEPHPERKSASEVKRWESRISSGGRSSLVIPPENQTVPLVVVQKPGTGHPSEPHHGTQIGRSPSPEVSRTQPPPYQTPPAQIQNRQHPERTSSIERPRSTSPQRPQHMKQSLNQPSSGSRLGNEPNPRAKSPQTLDQMSAKPSPLPGMNHSTNDLSFIPTLTEDKKADNRLTKAKKEEPRKSSWGWLLGKEEQPEKPEKGRQQKDDTSQKPKAKITKPPEKHENTRLDVLQSSIDSGSRGRESIVLDREGLRLEEERKKESARKSAGSDTKKEKDGLFSSIFGGGKKNKGDRDSGGKKYAGRALSPEPPPRQLKPDIDYNWTRFSILEERAIYRMAHIKLANPRRALYSQVLLSNFMYSYLAKVQMMHPQMNLPTSAKQQTQKQKKDQPEEFTQYQRYQEVRS